MFYCASPGHKSLDQGWGTYLLSQAVWIVEYCWWAAKI